MEEQTSEIQTPQHKSTQEITVEKIASTQDVELIPATPTSEIILIIEEIPPVYVVYSPTHKVSVKRKTKNRKLYVATITTLDNEQMDIV